MKRIRKCESLRKCVCKNCAKRCHCDTCEMETQYSVICAILMCGSKKEPIRSVARVW